MGLTVAFNNPAAHGRPAFQAPATVLEVLPSGACALNVQHQGGLTYIASAARGTNPGEWNFLPAAGAA